MRFNLIALFYGSILVIPQSIIAQPTTVRSSSHGVTLEVAFQPTYPKSSELIFTHSITNVAGGHIKTIQATNIYDLSITVLDPNGSLVQPFPRNETQFKRFVISDLLIGQTQSESINLAEYYPIIEAGEYRCSVTRQFYNAATMSASEFTQYRPGTPQTISSPQFRFRIASIDHTYKSPLADAALKSEVSGEEEKSPAKQTLIRPPRVQPFTKPELTEGKPESAQVDQTVSASQLLLFGMLVISVIGLFWLIQKNRK